MSLTPDFLLLIGFVMVAGAVLALIAALHVRGWFFTPEPRLELQPIPIARRRTHR